jgi:hypothetical protein
MNKLSLVAAACAALALSACTTTSMADFVKSANELDPDCGKLVQATVTPMFIFGWPIPVVSGSYIKACKTDQIPGQTQPGLTLGRVVGG